MLTTPRDLSGTGQVSDSYVVLRLQQSPVFLINSRLDLFTVPILARGVIPSSKPAPLLLEEFLNYSSPDRLGMLYPPTCVGLRYGLRAPFRGLKYGLTSFT